MKRNSLKALLIFLLLAGVELGLAATYHVAVNGADGASGSSTSPWKTLARANSLANAGDVVIVHAGEYTDGIRPANSGQPDRPITFQAAPGEKVVLRTATGVQLGAGSKHIVVDGFEVYASYRMAELEGSSYITIRNCKFYGGHGNYSAFSLNNASYCVIQNNYLNRQDPDNRTRVGDAIGGGDGLRLIGSSHHNLIEGNTATRCEHVAFASSFSKATVYQSYNVWRNNTSYNNHTNYSLQDGVQRCVFENNKSYYPGLVWTGGNGNCLQFTGTNCIIRFNTLYDDTGTIYTDRKWPALIGTGSGSANGGTPSMQYNKIYHNTVYGETDQKGWDKAGWRIDNNSSAEMYQNYNVFKNNIIAKARAAQVDDIDAVRSLASMNNRYEGNLLLGSTGQPARVRYEYYGGASVWTLEEAKRAKPNQWALSNKEGDPLFVNTVAQGPGKDFRLRQGSPAVDAAVPLTSTAGTGSASARLVVADAGYFIDGWGIPGVEADSIKIGNNAPVKAARVDYATNTITLSGPCSWQSGDPVFYYRSDRFQGGAPDIGAHEYRSGPNVQGAPSVPAPVSPADESAAQPAALIQFSWEATLGATSYHLQVAADLAMTQLVEDQPALSVPRFTVDSLPVASAYHWRVAAKNAAGTSSWSPVRRFSVSAGQSQGRNILSNSDFDAGTAPWTFYNNGTGSMQQLSPGFDDDQALLIAITQNGSNMQLYQSGVSLEPGTKYRLSFAACSNSGHGFDVVLQKHVAPYSGYGLNVPVSLTNVWQLYTLEFVSTNSTQVADGRLMFWLGSSAASGDRYWIDRITLESLGAASTTTPPEPGLLPLAYELAQNYPNPFNPSTTIRYAIPTSGQVTLKVYNVLGEEVAQLVNGVQPAGAREVRFDAARLSSGVYFYRLQAEGFQETKRMLLMK